MERDGGREREGGKGGGRVWERGQERHTERNVGIYAYGREGGERDRERG